MSILETGKATDPVLNGHNGHQNGHNKSEFLKSSVPLTVFLEHEVAKRVDLVGGKAASLTELNTIPGVRVPEAFVITTSLVNAILKQNPEIKTRVERLDQITDQWLKAKLTEDVEGGKALEGQIAMAGKMIKDMIGEAHLPAFAEESIGRDYDELSKKVGEENMAVAVRSSGISEDGEDNSFAGQYDTFLHQQGKEEVLVAVKKCLASQYNDRAIVYRNEGRLKITREALRGNPDVDRAIEASRGLSHEQSKLAVVVQEMVNASASGVAFSIDSITGADFIVIQANNGIGESLVSGAVTPDFYLVDPRTMLIIERRLGKKAVKTSYVDGGTENIEVSQAERNKFALTDTEVLGIAKGVISIKKGYSKEVDTEWALDQKREGKWLQARPETVASKKDPKIIEMRGYIIPEAIAEEAEVVLQGGMTGSGGTASGEKMLVDTVEEANRILELEKNKNKDFILVANMTTPDWLEVMRDKRVKAIITRSGAPDCHAALVSREVVGIPCLVGTEEAFDALKNDAINEITLDAEATKVYKGKLPLEEVKDDIDTREILSNPTETIIGINIAMPAEARKLHALGELGKNFKNTLSRAEFILQDIGVHVNALVDFDKGKIAPESDLYKRIVEKIASYGSGKEYFIDKLSKGITGSAAALPNSEMTYRTTDFKTNEYANLIGGAEYESKEANPMMGMRGLVRFLSPENFVKQLVKAGIGSIGVSKDRYLRTYRNVREVEEGLKSQATATTIFTAN